MALLELLARGLLRFRHRPVGRCVPTGPTEQLGELALYRLHPRDVVQPDRAMGAGVADHEGAAAEHPVENALVVGDVADPVQRDVVPPSGDQALTRDQPLVGDRVRRGEPGEERAEHEPHEHEQRHDPVAEAHGAVAGLAVEVDRRCEQDDQDDDRQDQCLGVRAGVDDDGLAVGQQLG